MWINTMSDIIRMNFCIAFILVWFGLVYLFVRSVIHVTLDTSVIYYNTTYNTIQYNK